MAYKVAFASSDGKVVNQHFGRAKQFLIVELDNNKKEYRFLEKRINEPACQDFEHTSEGLSKSIGLISDCKVVFVARIGSGASSMVVENGIQPIEMPHFIEDIIEKIFEAKFKFLDFE